jgi:hypothetical protein
MASLNRYTQIVTDKFTRKPSSLVLPSLFTLRFHDCVDAVPPACVVAIVNAHTLASYTETIAIGMHPKVLFVMVVGPFAASIALPNDLISEIKESVKKWKGYMLFAKVVVVCADSHSAMDHLTDDATAAIQKHADAFHTEMGIPLVFTNSKSHFAVCSNPTNNGNVRLPSEGVVGGV